MDAYRQYYVGVSLCTVVASVDLLYSSGNANLVLQFQLKISCFLTLGEKMLMKTTMF